MLRYAEFSERFYTYLKKFYKDLNFTTLNIYLVIVIVDPLKVQYERGLDAN